MKMRILYFAAVLLVLAAGMAVAQQDWALKQLEESPRHHEWVEVDAGDRMVKCFVTYPEVSHKAGVVVVIHENRGLNDWARSIADQIAGMGYITIAPDMLSGKAPNGGATADFENSDAARTAIYELTREEVLNGLNAAADYAAALPASSGEVAVAGFCWGGSQTWNLAVDRSSLKAAFVFYGTGPDEAEAIEQINCPVYGFYGGNDNRVNATIEKSQELMQAAGKTFEPVIYEGAGHGFVRSGEMPDAGEANVTGREQALSRLKFLLYETLRKGD